MIFMLVLVIRSGSHYLHMKCHFLPQRLEVKLWLGDEISILGQAVYAIYSGTHSPSYLTL
jgi:hypothetical protein